ncbi:MAG: regulatory iron-sulfur-containing complex subunit RicT [Chitinophagaceae bacterium]
MNTYDWLHNLPMADIDTSCKVIEVSFNKGTRKDFFRNPNLQNFEKGEMIAVEGVSGFDVGEVSLTGEIVRLQMKKRNVREDNPEMKKVLRNATDRDIDLMNQNKAREPEAVIRSRAIAKQLKLDMKVSQVEMQADGRKATFFYIADGRVDFRELIKIYASEFKVKVEMRQIGARQEAGKVGGIGSCGRELCCSTWLTDFKSVNTAAARYQNLSINQTKLSGQCGRLKCCLNYELDTYLDALQHFPDNCDQIQVAKGNAYLIKKDIFKNLMWYTLPDSNKQYPLTIDRVIKIKSLNRQGIIPEELEAVEVTTGKPKEIEPEFVDVVGQITLRSLEKADKKRKGGSERDRRGQSQRTQQRQGGGSERPGAPGRGERPAGQNQQGRRERGPQDRGQQDRERGPQDRGQQDRERGPQDRGPQDRGQQDRERGPQGGGQQDRERGPQDRGPQDRSNRPPQSERGPNDRSGKQGSNEQRGGNERPPRNNEGRQDRPGRNDRGNSNRGGNPQGRQNQPDRQGGDQPNPDNKNVSSDRQGPQSRGDRNPRPERGPNERNDRPPRGNNESGGQASQRPPNPDRPPQGNDGPPSE